MPGGRDGSLGQAGGLGGEGGRPLDGLDIDLAEKRIVCVKSSQHFHAGFAPIASEVIHVATPGSITPDYASIPYTKRKPNYWPRMENPFQ